ncbi:iron-siderophore ABC transporter substrate-binding protein [Streptomyces sp. NPDC006638]|uniref:ABC transporter substrate-binding protein n=1 Tax=Streptomyces sp. NPDC006638 TaxID=3157183 RepID=UPI0033A19953
MSVVSVVSTPLARRLTAAATAAAFLLTLTACGGNGAGNGASGTDSSSGSSGGDGAPPAATHTLATVMGDVKVPHTPRRIVVLDTDALDSVVTLGTTPVGATTVADGAPLSAYLPADRLKGVEPVGLIGAPNLEAIAALKPDLILSSKVRDGKNYTALSAIAPTVFSETTGPSWRQNFALHAEAVGKKPEADRIAAAYDAHVARLTTALGGPAEAKKTKVGFVRFVEGADTRLYLNDTFVGSLFKDLGVGRPANQDTAGFSLDVSPEQIDKADADVLYHSTYGDPAKAKETATTAGPLWKNLTAVKKGHAFAVDDNLWMLGIGYTGADKILDTIEKTYVSARR